MKTIHWILIILALLGVAAFFIIRANKKAAKSQKKTRGDKDDNGDAETPPFEPMEQPKGNPEPTIDVEEFARDVYDLIVESIRQESSLERKQMNGERVKSVDVQLNEHMIKMVNMASQPANFFGILNAYGHRIIPGTDSGEADLIKGYSYSPYAQEQFVRGLNGVIAKITKDITGKRCAGGTWQLINGEWTCVFDK